jgi:DNA-binding NtrC family response regulator
LAASPHPFDLILTDYNMPHGDGVTLASEASKLFPQTPVVLMSGYSDKVQPEAFRKFGFVAFLSKPFLFTELDACVRQILAGDGTAGGSRHAKASSRLAS